MNAHQRLVEGAQVGGVHAAVEGPAGGRPEPLGAVLLAPERLDHPDADRALLGHLGHHAHALLDVDQHRVGAAAVTPGDQAEDRPHQQGEQGQLPVHPQQDARHDEQREELHEEEDEPVAEEEAHGLQVAGRARHELADGHAVVVGHGHALQVREEDGAQVELDREADLAGDPAPDHAERHARHDHDDDGPHQWRERAAVAAAQHVVDHPAGQVWQGDGARQEAGCAEGGDGHPAGVGPQEAQQATEDSQGDSLVNDREGPRTAQGRAALVVDVPAARSRSLPWPTPCRT